MMRITLDSPALIAVRQWLTRSGAPSSRRSAGRRLASRTTFRAEPLEPRTMLDAGMRAFLPDLVESSDTGFSSTDNITSDRTPTLAGRVQGQASEVRLFIDGKSAAVVPVEGGAWNYTVPAEAALAAGRHTVTVRPVAASGKEGPISKPLPIQVETASPTAPTVTIGMQSDTGVKGDGETTFASPMLRGTAPRGQWVTVAIDGVPAGRVRSDARTGAWMLKAPQLATGAHDVTVVAENRAGLESAATSFAVAVDGLRTVMLDAVSGQPVELMASHLLGQGSQGFIVTQVHRGTLERWSAARNAWVAIPKAPASTAAMLQAPAAIRRVAFDDVVRWTPGRGDVGSAPAFDVVPLDLPGGPTAAIPAAGAVPGRIRDPRITFTPGVGTTLKWDAPTDGCGCPSTRYSIEVTREDGQTRLYSVPASVTQLSVTEGGRVLQAEMWGATKAGAGTKRWHDAVVEQQIKNRLAYNLTSGLSALPVGLKARAQLAWSPTGVDGSRTSVALGGSHADLAYLEVSSVPDAAEAAQGLPAGTPIVISADSNKLTATQKAKLEANPILARNLFPGTVDGRVQPDQVRAHFQAGETLRFAGTVDARIRAGATIVVEEAQILGDNSVGPWFEKVRIAVPADGGYAYEHVVPYGMTSVRVRLEHPTAPAPAAVMGASTPAAAPAASTQKVTSTPIDLSGSFNAFGITTAPWQAPNHQGFDRAGNYYDSDYTGPGTSAPIPGHPIVYNGIEFNIGPIPTEAGQVGGSGNSSKKNPFNFVQATGQKIDVSVAAADSHYLYLAGAAVNGNQMSQKIVLAFTDGTTETWTQSFHDWASSGPAQSTSQTSSTRTLLPVTVATTEGLAALSGLQTIDGVALVAGDRVLVKNQGVIPAGGGAAVGVATDNGIYIASAGAWTRAKDADTGSDLQNAATTVAVGTVNGGTYFVETSGAVTLGTTPILFAAETPPVPTPRPFAGELLLKTEPERVNQLGNLETTPAHVFAYCYNLRGKQLASITLPTNVNLGILSAVVAKAPAVAVDTGITSVILGTTNLTGVDLMALTIANESNIGAGGGPLTFNFADQPQQGSVATPTQPATYTTKQITVPMGQQTKIAYIAPDSTSQMTFFVQKPADDCVGANCSTYLTDWNNGSGNNKLWAGNLSPSLNSQMKAGQSWTMTIQNAGEGYYGYLDCPVVPGLPGANGSTPAGAQFKLETQAEINSQPPWAVALEEDLGTALALVGLAVLTGGIGDVAVVAADVGTEVATEAVTEAGTEATISAAVTGEITNEAGDIVVSTWYENLITDSFIEEVTGTGEGGVFFGEDIEVITNVDDIDSVLNGSWSALDAEFDAEVEVDIGLAEQKQIVRVDTIAEQMNQAVINAFRGGFF